MNLSVSIDAHSGFCGGVIRAISKAEDFLSDGGRTLYSLGSIVHNEAELSRLEAKGLRTATSLETLSGCDVLIRAHGEPPQTYKTASRLGINLIDCTCPVVLQLQKHIRRSYDAGFRIIIFGKVGHAEVLGLVGQVDGDAVVVEDSAMLSEALSDGRIDTSRDIAIFSQTTKSPAGYAEVCDALQGAMRGGNLVIHNTICSQVASRHSQLSEFAAAHDAVVFVAGKDSSNGHVLYDLCRRINPRTHLVGSPQDIRKGFFRDGDSVGVCGATSTPKWLLEAVAAAIKAL